MEQPHLAEIFQSVPYSATKHSTYFPVYEKLFQRFVGQGITFVEVGILNGGSLFMWREYFQNARIIGIDLNPSVEKWKAHGFEVCIGDQASDAFWEDFYRRIGPVDVLLDDGGHANDQQTVTVDHALRHVRDGGLVVVEDVHASYLAEFGNPSRYSFVNLAKRSVDALNARFPGVPQPEDAFARQVRSRVHAIEFYESIVGFQVDTRLCQVSARVTNAGQTSQAEDARWAGTAAESLRTGALAGLIQRVKRVPLLRKVGLGLYGGLVRSSARFRNRRLARYFG